MTLDLSKLKEDDLDLFVTRCERMKPEEGDTFTQLYQGGTLEGLLTNGSVTMLPRLSRYIQAGLLYHPTETRVRPGHTFQNIRSDVWMLTEEGRKWKTLAKI